MRWNDSRPGNDAWVGVDPSVGRYVASLEIEIGRFESRQQELRLDHREEIARLQKQLEDRRSRVWYRAADLLVRGSLLL